MDDQTPNTSPDSAEADGTTPTADGDAKAPEFELVTIEYAGLKFQVPKDRGLWDMNVQFEFEEGRRLRGLLTLLGGSPDHIDDARRKVYSKMRTNREVDQFMDHCTEVLNRDCIG